LGRFFNVSPARNVGVYPETDSLPKQHTPLLAAGLLISVSAPGHPAKKGGFGRISA